MTTAFDALRDCLRKTGIGPDPHEDAQRLESALARAGFAVLPVSGCWEVGQSSVVPSRSVLIVDDLDASAARDAADVIEDMGYCMIAPGSLMESHEEYVNDVQELAPGVIRREIVWRRDKAGVWHPRRKTVWDHRREAAWRLYCRVRGFVWYGGWRRFVEFTVWHRVMRAAGYQYHYDYATKTYGWQRKPRKLPPWQREAMRGRDR